MFIALNIVLLVFQLLSVHVDFLTLLSSKSHLCLTRECAKDVWNTLVSKPAASLYDQEVRLYDGKYLFFLLLKKEY